MQGVQGRLLLGRPEASAVVAAPAIKLRPYQEAAIAAVLGQYDAGVPRTMIVLPTGGGKTIVASALVQRMQQRGAARTLFLAHREELIFQTVEKMRLVLGRNLDIGVVKAERNEPDAAVVVASVQTVQNAKRFAQLGAFDFVIADEAHHATATSWMKVLGNAGVFDAGGPPLFGMTATPDRTDGAGLSHVFASIAYEVGIFEMIDQGYLVDIVAKEVLLEQADFGRIRVTGGEFNAGDAGRELMRSQAPGVIAQAIREHAADRQTIVFVPTVEVAHVTAASIRATGISAKALDAGTPADERRQMIADLHAGTLQVICNVGVLTEGTDIPAVSCIVYAAPTKSRSKYVQAIGRGLRTHIGKEDCLVLDLVGATGQHRLQTVASLFGVAPKRLAKQSVRAAVRAQEAEAEEASGQLVVRDLGDLRARVMHWITTANGQFVLPAPPGLVLLRYGGPTPLGEPGWEVWHVDEQKRATRRYADLPLDYAQGVAEDMVRELGVDETNPLVRRDAPWRTQPVTEAQLKRCAWLGVPTEKLTTKGEASDAMNAAEAMRKLQQIADGKDGERLWQR